MGKMLEFVGRHSSGLMVVMAVLVVVGIACASTFMAGGVSLNVIPILFSVAGISALIGVGIWAGITKKSLAMLEDFKKDITKEIQGLRRDLNTDGRSLETRITANVTRIVAIELRLQEIEQVQRDCDWYNRKPKEFVAKGD